MLVLQPVGSSPDEGFYLTVRVTPKGGRNEILPYQCGDEYVRLKVTALPEDGKANQAVVVLLSKTLGVAKSNIRLVSGEQSRVKRFQILPAGNMDAVLGKLTQALGNPPVMFIRPDSSK